MTMQVPSHRDASVRTQVICKAKCMYCTLSDNAYLAGMKYFEVPSEHNQLLQSWGGLPSSASAKQSGTTSIDDLLNMV